MIWVSELKLVWSTAQKMKFFIKNLFSKCDQIRRKLRIWSQLLKKSLMENFIFYPVKGKLPLGPVKISLISSIGTKYNPLNCFILWGSGHKYLQFESTSTVSGNILGCTRHVSITCEVFNVLFGPCISSLSIPLQRVYESSRSKWITTLQTKKNNKKLERTSLT